jgi:hypothetical protein
MIESMSELVIPMERRERARVTSPELALIDPELARREPAEPVAPRPSATVRPVPAAEESSEEVDMQSIVAELRRRLADEDLSTIDEADDEWTTAAPVRLLRQPRALLALAVPLLVAGVVLIATVLWPHGSTKANRSTNAAATRGTRGVAQLTALRPHAFAWAAVPKAAYYRVRFFRNGKEVFAANPVRPSVVLPAHWQFSGATRSLTPGTYHWIVQPGFGSPSAKRYGATLLAADWVATH